MERDGRPKKCRLCRMQEGPSPPKEGPPLALGEPQRTRFA